VWTTAALALVSIVALSLYMVQLNLDYDAQEEAFEVQSRTAHQWASQQTHLDLSQDIGALYF